MGRLIVVSNRVATPTETKGSAGGLAVGVFGALKDASGGALGSAKNVGHRVNVLFSDVRSRQRDSHERCDLGAVIDMRLPG